ncbi:MAG: biotin-dependent carboxyltransferase family protein [Cyclobacteriaceae bacterium]
MGKLKVIKASGLSTIQDEGRFGYRQYGIPQSGAMDVVAMHAANELVGNSPDSPVIETAIQGLTLEAAEDSIVGLTGAEVSLTVNGNKTAMNTSIQLTKGDVLTISPPLTGVYSYLGIGGDLVATEDFGSKSTYLLAGFGGLSGQRLGKEDVLETKNAPSFKKKSIKKKANSQAEVQTIRIMKGPEWSLLKDLPERMIFKIDPSSNKMGIRLQGDPIGVDGKEIVSSAVIPGTIQVPSNGLPIVLMNDCQTTGGYPRMGKVIDADLGLLAQIPAGGKIRFALVTI